MRGSCRKASAIATRRQCPVLEEKIVALRRANPDHGVRRIRDALRRVRRPVLEIFGEEDTTVPPAENLERMESYLAAAGVPHATTVIPGLPRSVTTHHELKDGRWDWPDGFWVWSRRPAAIDSVISAWVGRSSGIHGP